MATIHNFRVKNGLEVAGVVIADDEGVLQLPSTLTASTQSLGTSNTTLATTSFVSAAVSAAAADYTLSVVATLPASPDANTIYFVTG